MRKIFFLLIIGFLLAACGSPASKAASGTTTGQGAVTSSTTATSSSTKVSSSAFPSPCSLITKAQVSSIMSVPINSITSDPSGNTPQCTWSYKSSKLVTGLGSNAVLEISRPSPGQTPTMYYQILFDAANKPYEFRKTLVDNIPAAIGFLNNEVEVDTGSALISIATLSTVHGSDNAKDAEELAGIAVTNFCSRLSCVK